MERLLLHKFLNVGRWVFAALAIFFVAYYFYSNETLAELLFIGELFWFLTMGLTAVMIYARIPRKNKGEKRETLELILLIAFVGVAFAFGMIYLLIQ